MTLKFYMLHAASPGRDCSEISPRVLVSEGIQRIGCETSFGSALIHQHTESWHHPLADCSSSMSQYRSWLPPVQHNYGSLHKKLRTPPTWFSKKNHFFCNGVDALQYFICLQSRKLGQSPMLLVFLFSRQGLSSHQVCQFLYFAKVCLSRRLQVGNEHGLDVL